MIFFVIFFVTILISTYELVSIFENIFVINSKLSFLPYLINFSNKLNKKAISYSGGKIVGAEINGIDIKTEITVKNKDEQSNHNEGSEIKE